MATPSPPHSHSPSPSPSPSPPPPPPPPPSNPIPTLQTKKPQPLPWTHQETVHLIQSYQEKWYSLKRGQLKASQWEEVAVTVAARCGYDYNHPAKSSIQCRHKMEKLRRRYRDERRHVSLGRMSSWQYFELMDSLERGPFPISARPLALIPCRENNGNNNKNSGSTNSTNNYVLRENRKNECEGNEEEEEEEDYGYRSKSRSINYILRKPTIVNRFAGGHSDSKEYLRDVGLRKRKREDVREEEEERRVGVELGLAREIRGFAERMMGVERKKMAMVKETERWRVEMENKRMGMILDSQRKIVDMIAAAFGSGKELKTEEGF